MSDSLHGFRGSIFHFPDRAGLGQPPIFQSIEDGLLLVENGHVKAVGEFERLRKTLPSGLSITDHSGRIIMPGFVDAHIHYAQTDIVASYGKQLLSWLTEYTYPAEIRFADENHSRETAGFFLKELIRNGTTTALVLPTVHACSVHALFEAAEALNMRIVSGKILMDRNCPEALRDTAEQGASDMRAIIERWHLKNRLTCAVMPRFALTSTEAQLQAAAELVRERPGLLFHTHLSENTDEISSVASLYPARRSYLDVYDHLGLTGQHSVFAHGVHLNQKDRMRLAETGSALVHCPTSNLFLGSGLFDLNAMKDHRIPLGLGTDVGAGTSFSMFKTMAEAYKVSQLKGNSLSPQDGFYMATLGGAEVLGLDDNIGNFNAGKEADFIVIDGGRIPLLKRRLATAKSMIDVLFALMILGDDRIIEHCYILGKDMTPFSSNADIRQQGAE